MTTPTSSESGGAPRSGRPLLGRDLNRGSSLELSESEPPELSDKLLAISSLDEGLSGIASCQWSSGGGGATEIQIKDTVHVIMARGC